MVYDCIIIGGGIAGLQAAIQLGRYKHKVLVVDSNDGRSTICQSYHNILGYPDGVSGQTLRTIGRSQAETLGVEFNEDTVVTAKKQDDTFTLKSAQGYDLIAKRILIATGVMDRIPSFAEIYPCLGKSIYVCPDCDGYEINDKRTIIMGSGHAGANMALTLTYWSNDLIYVNHEKENIAPSKLEKLRQHHIQYEEFQIEDILAQDSQFKGVRLENGQEINAEKGFLALGGNEVRSDIAKQLGVERLENRHIPVDSRSKMTNVPNVWAAGDVVAHSEQVTIAMGEGSQAGIWIHKSLIQ
ncbi:NAD(P)/FAD-dependent oxidoreductase [Salinibacillus xinjiangensis]|uniref:FAD-binding protein n=1 Tax=Salinibacillus xinjiangensis TaxID=1229268 RepID=A0A6G1X5U7_9BACI|nr:NAD(P)/FAD-dependent oxidoreductase [Salinibacillus xinjiangensis]MRG86312.1 FAD-binding protein [Salinibacillus xinjiangensis]